MVSGSGLRGGTETGTSSGILRTRAHRHREFSQCGGVQEGVQLGCKVIQFRRGLEQLHSETENK